MRIDDAVRELSEALESIGWGPLEPPKDMGALVELEALIAPLTVPAELRRFWELVDVYSRGIQTIGSLSYPEMEDLPHVVEQWKTFVGDQPELFPTALLVIAYESHQCLAVELDDPRHGPGGTLWGFNLVGESFHLEYLTLSDWIDVMTADVRAGKVAVERTDRWEGLVPAGERNEDEPEPATSISHPFYGSSPWIPRGHDNRLWPLHWQRSAELGWGMPLHHEALGETYDRATGISSVAEVLVVETDEPREATIVGTVVDFAIGREWERVRVSDGSGTVELHASRGGTGAKGVDSGQLLEFDIVIPGGARDEPRPFTMVEGATLEDLLDPVSRGLLQRFEGGPDIELRAVRTPRS